jgi:hypothetical protein
MALSPFATLLRNSKFATFDPAIAQVYTSYGGDAHRGQFGFKRPLPLRRRRAFLVADAVDSPSQQSEWTPAEDRVRFIRRWDELRVDAHVTGSRLQNSGEWHVDSEFAPARIEEASSTMRGGWTTAVPNIYAMTDQEFASYLNKLRKLRPEFQEFVRTALENHPTRRGKPLHELAQTRDVDYHKHFIAAKSVETFNSNNPKTVEPVPHRTGGLSYSHPSPLETFFTTRAQPGIVVQEPMHTRPMRRRDNAQMASFAGLNASIRVRESGGKIPVFTLRDGIVHDQIADSIAQMRLLRPPMLLTVPRVVGREKDGIEGASMKVEVTAAADFMRPNPYMPGSKQYNDAEPLSENAKEDRRVEPMAFMSPRNLARKKLKFPAGKAMDILLAWHKKNPMA